jgi:uncharacterized membrane protein YeaQ/YmgE (transglycosylase-associated protein family)
MDGHSRAAPSLQEILLREIPACRVRVELGSGRERCPAETNLAATNLARAMGILAWIVLGLIAGFIASKIVNRQGAGCLLDIVLGIVGAFVGGIIFSELGGTGVTGFNIWSLFVAVIGAVVVLVIYHTLFDRRY